MLPTAEPAVPKSREVVDEKVPVLVALRVPVTATPAAVRDSA
jgi:hypothetical protein